MKRSADNTTLSKCLFGSRTYKFYIFIYILLSISILMRVEYFPDFFNYDQYIKNGSSIVRFRVEPINAWLMKCVGILGYGARFYYNFIWLISSLLLFIIPITFGKRFNIFSVFLLVNPLSIIMFQTPRQFLSYSFFILAFMYSLRWKFLFSILTIASHTISGLLTIFLVVLARFKNIMFSIFLIAGLLLLLYVKEKTYNFYGSGETQRGVGRLLIFLLFVITNIFLSYKKNFVTLLPLFSVLIFSVLTYNITPYAGRILPFLIPIVLLYSFNSFKSRDSHIVIHALLLSNITVSLFAVILGRFGFG